MALRGDRPSTGRGGDEGKASEELVGPRLALTQLYLDVQEVRAACRIGVATHDEPGYAGANVAARSA
jgi:hypothetical protein